MKMKVNKFMLITALFIGAGLLTAARISPYAKIQSDGDWIAPKSADNIKNPLAGDANAAKAGKKLYNQMCAVCHGSKGKGDGMAGVNLKPRPSNLASNKVQSQTDGAIFWKISEGRAPMASYKKAFTETQRWQLVNYIRQLAK